MARANPPKTTAKIVVHLFRILMTSSCRAIVATALMSISFPLLKGLIVQANNNLATDVPSPIELNSCARRRRAANYCAARRGIFRARSMTEAAMPSRKVGRARRLGRGFLLHLDRAREEQVVFKMNVLMQIGLERGQSLVERLKTDTAVRRRRIPFGYAAQLSQ